MPGNSPAEQSSRFSADHLARKNRMDAAKRLEQPDRIPVAPVSIHYYPNIRKGVPNSEMHYNRPLRHELWRDVTVEHDWDAAVTFQNLLEGRALELIGARQIKWPGGGVSANQPFQYVEDEYMLQGEYDEMLADPTAFAVNKLLPRVARSLAPFSTVTADAPPGLLLLTNCYALPGFFGGLLSDPGMVSMLERLLVLAKDREESQQAMAHYVGEMTRLGFPIPYLVANIIAFDCISDMLRGLRGSMLDMYQVPDKLLAAVEMFIPWTVAQTVWKAKQTGSEGVFLALHRGAAGFMSDEQFSKFYWPGLRAIIIGLLDAGITPIPFFEGDYTPRLKYLQELPPGQVLGHFDRVDRRKAREFLGEVMCFWGNVRTSLLCHGTPQQVKDDVRELIEIFGDTGGLIIDGSVGIPDEAKPENLHALTEAAHEWGTY